MIRSPWLVIFTSLLLFIWVLETLILSGKQVVIFKLRCIHWGNSCIYRLNKTCGKGIWILQMLTMLSLIIFDTIGIHLHLLNSAYRKWEFHLYVLKNAPITCWSGSCCVSVSSSEEIESVILIQLGRILGWQRRILSEPWPVYACHCTTRHNEVKNHRK